MWPPLVTEAGSEVFQNQNAASSDRLLQFSVPEAHQAKSTVPIGKGQKLCGLVLVTSESRGQRFLSSAEEVRFPITSRPRLYPVLFTLGFLKILYTGRVDHGRLG